MATCLRLCMKLCTKSSREQDFAVEEESLAVCMDLVKLLINNHL